MAPERAALRDQSESMFLKARRLMLNDRVRAHKQQSKAVGEPIARLQRALQVKDCDAAIEDDCNVRLHAQDLVGARIRGAD